MSKRGGAPTPKGGGPTVRPALRKTVRFQGGRLGLQGIRTQPLSQSCFPD